MESDTQNSRIKILEDYVYTLEKEVTDLSKEIMALRYKINNAEEPTNGTVVI